MENEQNEQNEHNEKTSSDMDFLVNSIEQREKKTIVINSNKNQQNNGKDKEKSSSNILRVKADPPGISDEERKRRVKALAGAIAHGLRKFGEVHVRAIGKDVTYKAVKAIIEASAFVAVHNHDLYTRPGYMTIDDQDGEEMTGISFLIVTSQSS